jgi:hemerythrin
MTRLLRIEDLLVGHDEIDAQHETLVRRFGDVRQAVGAADSAALGAALARLWDATVGHFATEDALMEELAYPERAAHRAAHQLFLEDLKALLREREGHGVSEEVSSWSLHRLPEWLTFHIQTNDAPLARFIARKNARDMIATALNQARADRRSQDS